MIRVLSYRHGEGLKLQKKITVLCTSFKIARRSVKQLCYHIKKEQKRFNCTVLGIFIRGIFVFSDFSTKIFCSKSSWFSLYDRNIELWSNRFFISFRCWLTLVFYYFWRTKIAWGCLLNYDLLKCNISPKDFEGHQWYFGNPNTKFWILKLHFLTF